MGKVCFQFDMLIISYKEPLKGGGGGGGGGG